MVVESTEPAPYQLSFTSGALLLREAAVAAPLYLREGDWGQVRAAIVRDNLLQARTVASGTRLAREVVQRLSMLNRDEVEALVDSTRTERGYLLWVAACRRYEFIADFAQEVMRERYLLMRPTIGHTDFDDFLDRKSLWHTELADLTPSTTHKLRANLFRMMREASLLTGDSHVIGATFSKRLAALLTTRVPSDARYFPIADAALGDLR